MFGMWDVREVGCSGCGMWDVRDVGCGMFAGMWNVDLQNAEQCIANTSKHKNIVLVLTNFPDNDKIMKLQFQMVFLVNYFIKHA